MSLFLAVLATVIIIVVAIILIRKYESSGVMGSMFMIISFGLALSGVITGNFHFIIAGLATLIITVPVSCFLSLLLDL